LRGGRDAAIAMAMVAPQIPIDRDVIDRLLPDLVGHDRRPSAFLVYLVILGASADGRVAMSHAELAERTGVSRRAVQDAISLLRRRQLIEVMRRGTTETAEYRALPLRRGRTAL
jgi:transcription initiation factor IIE alpha subunit